MQTDFLVLTDEELLAVHGGKGRMNCLPKFLSRSARINNQKNSLKEI